MNIRNLKNPPIAEALILVIPELEKEATAEQLSKIKNNLSANYPHATEKKLNALSLSIKENKASLLHKEENKGYELSSADKKIVIQIDPDKLIISRLPPYKDGDELVSLCNEIAGVYLDVLQADKIKHLALRYINKMNVWSNKIDTDVKVKVSLSCESKELNSPNVASRFQIYSPDYDAGGVVNYVVDVPLKPERDKNLGILLDVILDIDVYRVNIPVPSNVRFDDDFKKLRDFKNLIFFENFDESFLKGFDQ